MKIIIISTILASISLISVAASAQDGNDKAFSNTWLDIEYLDVDNDWGNGLKVTGSYGINDQLNFIGSWTDIDNATGLTAGFSYAFNLTENKNLSLLLHGEISHLQLSPSGENSACFLGGELRFQATAPLELYSDIYYSTVNDGEWGIDSGARYNVTPAIQLIAGVDINTYNSFHFGTRFNF